jgi:hypothetical protein
MQPPRHGPAVGWSGVVGAGPITVDEASMESSQSFIKALQVRCISLLPAFPPPPAQISLKGMIFIPASPLTVYLISLVDPVVS